MALNIDKFDPSHTVEQARIITNINPNFKLWVYQNSDLGPLTVDATKTINVHPEWWYRNDDGVLLKSSQGYFFNHSRTYGKMQMADEVRAMVRCGEMGGLDVYGRYNNFTYHGDLVNWTISVDLLDTDFQEVGLCDWYMNATSVNGSLSSWRSSLRTSSMRQSMTKQ